MNKKLVVNEANLNVLFKAEHALASSQRYNVKFGRLVGIVLAALDLAEDVMGGNMLNGNRFSSGNFGEFQKVLTLGISALNTINANLTIKPALFAKAVEILRDLRKVSFEYEGKPHEKEEGRDGPNGDDDTPNYLRS